MKNYIQGLFILIGIVTTVVSTIEEAYSQTSGLIGKFDGRNVQEARIRQVGKLAVSVQKYCFGIHIRYYSDLRLPSQNSSNKYRGAVVILDFLADYPAISSGLLEGDAIVSIEGYPADEKSIKDAGDYITGGRPIEMRVVRPSKYSITKSGSITLFPPFTEYVYSVPVKLCPWQR
jgi:hypothetical protein